MLAMVIVAALLLLVVLSVVVLILWFDSRCGSVARFRLELQVGRWFKVGMRVARHGERLDLSPEKSMREGQHDTSRSTR